MKYLKGLLLVVVIIMGLSLMQDTTNTGSRVQFGNVTFNTGNKPDIVGGKSKKSLFGKPDITADCSVYEDAEIKCDFVNKGNKAGRLCVETLVKQVYKKRIYRSYNCSGTVNANDRRTVVFPNNFRDQYIQRNGFSGFAGPCVLMNSSFDRNGNKLSLSEKQKIQRIWHYACDFEHKEHPQ